MFGCRGRVGAMPFRKALLKILKSHFVIAMYPSGTGPYILLLYTRDRSIEHELNMRILPSFFLYFSCHLISVSPVWYLFDSELCCIYMFRELFCCACNVLLFFSVQQEYFHFAHSTGGKFTRPATEGEKFEGFSGVWANEYAKRTSVLPLNDRHQGILSESGYWGR